MMDRRKLIKGGGAVAVATTLGAVAGTTAPAQAAPNRTRLTPISTADHAQRVLDEVNVDLGLVNPAGLHRQYEQCYADVLACPPREPNPDGLTAWVRRRMLQLCGTDSFADAVTKLPQTRSLLAFSLLAYSQNQDKPLPRIDPDAAVRPVFEKLEPDFLPVLLGLINEKREASRQFAAALEASSTTYDQIIAAKLREQLGDKGTKGWAQAAPSNPTVGDGLQLLGGVLVIMAVIYWVKGELKL